MTRRRSSTSRRSRSRSQRPPPLWSEQDPEAWWTATDTASLDALRTARRELAGVRAIGLTGQMHGAVLLDAAERVLRPAILWNDGRSAAECAELERRAPRLRAITGNLAMPGFTAPKLLVGRRARAGRLSRASRRCCCRRTTCACGSPASCAGDVRCLRHAVARRGRASLVARAARGERARGRRSMPRLVEGSRARRGQLRPELARALGIRVRRSSPVAPAIRRRGAIGVGVIRAGDAFLSLGTSGVMFVASARFDGRSRARRAHFLSRAPGTWHQMSVILSAASCSALGRARSGAADEAACCARSRPPAPASATRCLPAVPVGRAHAAQRPVRDGRLLRTDARHDARGAGARGARGRRVRARRRARGARARRRARSSRMCGDRWRRAQRLLAAHPGERPRPHARLGARRRRRPGVRRGAARAPRGNRRSGGAVCTPPPIERE